MQTRIRYLDGPRIRRCFQAGLQQLISERDYLNRINVFPVADGDTGNNLAHTARAGYAALADSSARGAGAVLLDLADGVLDGAQGNSGSILAQYFQGLAAAARDAERLDTHAFARAMEQAAATTREALQVPREGTILSVIDATAESARTLSASTDDFAVLLPQLRATAETALSATTEQLEELRRAGVIDAGARGFCALVQGCDTYLREGSIRAQPAPLRDTLAESTVHIAHDEPDPTYRYCTECMVAGADIDVAGLRHTLGELGDSLVVVGSGQRVKVHIHTDEPERVFELAERAGALLSTKADDMRVQARSLRRRDRDIVFVTDSGADIPADVMDELGIHMIPLRVLFGVESHLDKTGLSPAEFRELLRTHPETPGTSQPTPGDFRRMYDFLTTHFNEVVSLHLSGNLSGTFQAAVSAAERSAAGDRITVLDTRSVSVGQGLAVRRLAELAAEGLRGAELRTRFEAERARIRSFGLVTDLTNAVRSGRIKPGLKYMADWLRLTPILTDTPDGRIGTHSFLLGRHRLLERFAARVAASVDTSLAWEIALAHGAFDADNAVALGEQLLRRFPGSRICWNTETGAALGVHAGMEALIIGLLPAAQAPRSSDC